MQDGHYVFLSQPGAYRFARLTVKDHARVRFAASERPLQLGELEVQYGAVVWGHTLRLQSNGVIIRPGGLLELSGGGQGAGLGPGAGASTVSGLHYGEGLQLSYPEGIVSLV